MKEDIKTMIVESLQVKKAMLDESIIADIESAAKAILKAFMTGNQVFLAGNGGSAAQASHFAAEFVGRYKKERKALPAIALTVDSSLLTAWSNDYGYHTVFARQLHALAKPNDVFVAISTSGNSENIIRAVGEAKKLRMNVISLLGKGGGKMKNASDIEIIVPSDNTPVIQENHLMVFHIICEFVDKSIS